MSSKTEMDAEEKLKEEEMMAVEDFGDSRLAKIRLRSSRITLIYFVVVKIYDVGFP